jgi:small subunit ribosomal protein S2
MVQQIQSERPDQSPAPVTMKSLLEAGVHFGHQRRHWNPKMKQYIFAHRNGIHIIDLQQTLYYLERAAAFIEEVAASGKQVIIVGTKKQAADTVVAEAERCGAYFISTRWLGGTLTNFTTIQARIDHMVKLETRRDKGEFEVLPKKETLKLTDSITRLNRYLGGIKAMTEMPGALFVIDVGKEAIAVAEARRVGVPVVALVDTDCDPALLDWPIPGNDDAIRSIRLVTSHIANAIIHGNNRRLAMEADVEPSESGEEAVAQEVIVATPAVAEPAAPVAEAAVPVAEAPAPVAETATPVAEAAVPVAEAPAPVAETATPVAEAAVPVAEAPAPVIEADATE